MKNVLGYFDDLIWMLYPILCAACNKPLYKGENCICTKCLFNIPRTGFHLLPGNSVERHFWGKVKIHRAMAGFHFGKGQRVQKLIHQLKYKGRKDVGEFVGTLIGRQLCESEFNDIDIIVPVPLHKTRLKHRGYNQSDCFAEGLSKGMNKPAMYDALIRKEATNTQTKKHRYERFLNVDNIFEVKDKMQIEGKHILLVDDVITTGSTLISCAESILSAYGTKVSIAAIACA
jgi:ComF family protein